MSEKNEFLNENFAEDSKSSSLICQNSHMKSNNNNAPKIFQTELLNLFNKYFDNNNNNNNKNQKKIQKFLKEMAKQIDEYSKSMKDFEKFYTSRDYNINSDYSKKNEEINNNKKPFKDNKDSI